MLVARAPADPYFAQSLQAWEQGRFIRFHGAAQWVGWIWPYAALVYLLARLAAREPAGRRRAPRPSQAEQLQRQAMGARRRLGELVQHVHVMPPGHRLADRHRAPAPTPRR